MRVARLCLALSIVSFVVSASSGAGALQLAPGTYRVDWLIAPFAVPMWLVQCTASCPNDGLALVANPGAFPAGSLRVLGGPYRHGAELMLDRDRLLATGLPARALRVDVRDDRGQQLDGLVFASAGELGRLTASLTGGQAAPAASGQASPAPAASGSAATRPISTVCQFRFGPQTGRTVDFAGRPGVTGLPVGQHCADADGSLGVVVAPNATPR